MSVLAGLLATSASSCAGESESRQPPVIVVAVDGLEWGVMLPLLAQGQLPHLAELMQRGNYGLLSTIQPTLSPVIWTSIATGKSPEQHGIRDFVRVGDDQRLELFSNLDRRTKAVWNIASDYHRRVAVIGWWMTFPAEEVDGVMVAQTNTTNQLDTSGGNNVWKGTLVPGIEGQVYPPARQAEFLGILAEQDERLDARLGEIFGTFPHELSLLAERLWENCRWSFRADATYLAIAKRLLEEEAPFDLLAVYLGGPDVVGHRFWRFRRPDLYEHPPSPTERENLGGIIEDYYRFVDQEIGALVEREAGARILVVSDHGMRAVNLDKRFDPDAPPSDVNSAHHMQAPPGVFIAAGPDIVRLSEQPALGQLKRSDLPRVGSVLDIAPTVLTLMELPLGEDLEGQPQTEVLTREFLERHPPGKVKTHDSAEWIRRHQQRAGLDPGAEDRLEQLRELGYVGED